MKLIGQKTFMGILVHWVEIVHAEVGALCEKCQYSRFFWFVLSRIWTEYGEIPYLSVFTPNAGKYGPEEKLQIRTFFKQ